MVIDWSKIYADALKTNRIKNVDMECETLDIDEANKSDILRTRARKAVEDLQPMSMLWLKMQIAHVTRAPFSHALNSIQLFKGNAAVGADDGKGYLRWFPTVLTRSLAELVDMLSDDHVDDDDWWGLTLKEADALRQESDDSWSRSDMLSLIRQCVASNSAELIRRFGSLASFGATDSDGRNWFWRLFDLLDDGPVTDSPRRIAVIKQLIGLKESQSDLNDAFVSKFVHSFRMDLDACVASNGRMCDNLAYNLLKYIDDVVVGDVQGVESMNSVLRIMTTRARDISRDLLSARHVIRHSEKDLVTPETYTAEFKSDAQIVAKQGAQHERFQAMPIVHVAPPKRNYAHCVLGSGGETSLVKTRVKIASKVKSIVNQFDVIRVTLKCAGLTVAVGPWYIAGAHGRGALQGFLIDNDNGDLVTFSLPNVPMLLRSSYRDLVTLISDAIRQAPWPLQPGGRCTLSIAEIDEWSTQRSTRIDTWNVAEELKLPFKFRQAKVTTRTPEMANDNAICGGSPQADEQSASDFDLEQELHQIIGEDGDDSTSEPEHQLSGGSCGATKEEFIAMFADENPLMPDDQVAIDVESQRSGDNGDTEPEERCDDPSSSESSQSSDTNDSSSSGDSPSSGDSSGAECVAPAAGHALDVDRRTRGQNLGPTNMWIDVCCDRCGDMYGQLKDFSGFGRVEMFIYRQRRPDGTWPTQGVLFKRRQWSVDGVKAQCERWCRRWLKRHHRCSE